MGTTSEFLKLRSSGLVKTGEWNIDFDKAMSKAKANGKYVIVAWSNGDICSHCVTTENCMMTDTFKNWMKIVDAYFVFQCSDDPDEGKAAYDWVFASHMISAFPGFRVTMFDTKTGKPTRTWSFEGNALRDNKAGEAGAKAMIANISAFMGIKQADSKTAQDYKIRLNEQLTVAKVNKILDAIDKNDGYCPCQPKGDGTKCHCEDFLNKKKIGEPCICNIYMKQSKDAQLKPTKKTDKSAKIVKPTVKKTKKASSKKTK